MVSGSPPTSPGLTGRQRQVLQLIEHFLHEHGRPPTRADLAQALGLANRQGIDQHLRALARKGRIRLTPGVARGIQLPDRLSDQLPDQPVSDALLPETLTLQDRGIADAVPGIVPGTASQTAPGRLRRLPLYGRVAAGLPTLASGNIEDELLIDATLFRPRADFLLRVQGHSMRDAGILDRDILAVHRTATAANGQIVVARIGEEATVKYYYRQGPRLWLQPANPAFQPIEVDLRAQDCVIEGLAVGIVRAGLPLAPASPR